MTSYADFHSPRNNGLHYCRDRVDDAILILRGLGEDLVDVGKIGSSRFCSVGVGKQLGDEAADKAIAIGIGHHELFELLGFGITRSVAETCTRMHRLRLACLSGMVIFPNSR